ncbi:ABC transporter permease [Candidatus Saccharibacteria bacterium]|nr:ABC transporter permease [Candidatus Saccharibacteria bacterium]
MWNLLKSELIKARSVKSTWILSVVGILFVVWLAFVETSDMVAHSYDSGSDLWWLATNGVLESFQVIAGILAVLIVTSEYTSGTIKNSLLATPRRFKLFAAKLIFILLLIVPLTFIGEILSFITVWATQNGQLNDAGFWTAFTQDFANGCLAPLLAIALGSVIWFGLAWILRNSAGAILAGISLILLLPPIVDIGSTHPNLPSDWLPQAFLIQTFSAGSEFVRGIIGLSSYTIVALATSLIVFQKRDA